MNKKPRDRLATKANKIFNLIADLKGFSKYPDLLTSGERTNLINRLAFEINDLNEALYKNRDSIQFRL